MPSRIRWIAALACVLAVGAFAAASGGASPPVTASVFPTAGTPVASPRTQVSFRGATAAQLGRVSAVGSLSGTHPGRLVAHSDGQGASFLPAKPFAAGERVTVRAGVPLVGARGGAVTFTIARTAEPRRLVYEGDPAGTPPGSQPFHSLPGLLPPTLAVTTNKPGTAPGDIFVATKHGAGQDGPMITDPNGGLIWTDRVPQGTSAYDLRSQQYGGRPVLTWWQGRVFRPGEGHGVGLIYDSSYRRVATVRTGNGYSADFHEFQLTPGGTALMLAYEPVRVGRRVVVDGVVQEVDVKTGLVEFEWHSLGHVALSESYARAVHGLAYDYFHVNSVEPEADGNLLVSARNTSALYEIDHRTGAVLWRLGGKSSSFRMGAGTRFVAQHDARRAADGSITVFDNAAPPVSARPSRGIQLSIDANAHRASLTRAFVHRPRVIAQSQGSAQTLPNGDVFVGWGGASPYLSEYSGDGQLLFDAHFVPAGDDTYRAYRLPWHAQPAAPPDVAASTSGGATTVWASWNGATEVSAWQVLAGPSPSALQPVASAPRSGFETAISLPAAEPYVATRALGPSGETLGTSKTIAPAG